jgi:DNA gyrase subunit A
LELKSILTHFINHRIEVITRRTAFELKKAEERSHILKGLKTAIEDIDNVVKIIRRSKSPDEAKNELMSALSIDEIQAKSILDMRLQRLTGLEIQKILDELVELVKKIEYFNLLLSDKEEKYKVIKAELEEIKEKYGDDRRTEIIHDEIDFNVEDLIADEEMVISVTHGGYIKRNPLNIYRSQRRGGTGSKAMTVKDEDFAEEIFIASTHTYILFFTSSGRVHWMKVYEIPLISKIAKGKALAGLLNLKEGEKVNATVAIKEFKDEEFLIMATEQGVIKKTALSAFKNPRTGGIVAINLDEHDKLIGVQRSNGEQKVFLGTKKGQAILFNEKNVRDVGRTARGVRGISLSKDDIVMGMEVVNDDSVILTVTENGYGKRTNVSDYRLIKRGGKGVINIKVVEKNGLVSGIIRVNNEDDIMVITAGGTLIRMQVKEISVIGRNTQGVRLIDIKSDSKVIGVARVEDEEENSSEEQN